MKQLAVNTSGTVYAGTYSGTVVTDPLYMYANEETIVSLAGTNTVNAWVQPNLFGLGHAAPVAALNKNGQIAFQIDQTMSPGFYRLDVTSGNIGKVDANFIGFNTVVTVGDVPFQAILCGSQTGADFSQTDSFQFTLPHLLPGSPSSWLLSFDWTNALNDPAKGTTRQLFISSIKLTRLHASLYKVFIGTTGAVNLTPMNTDGAAYPITPGGWLAKMTSWGTAYGYAHESTAYSANDTLADPQSLSNKLGPLTPLRREDIILNGSFTLPDLVTPPLTVYGPIVHTGS